MGILAYLCIQIGLRKWKKILALSFCLWFQSSLSRKFLDIKLSEVSVSKTVFGGAPYSWLTLRVGGD